MEIITSICSEHIDKNSLGMVAIMKGWKTKKADTMENYNGPSGRQVGRIVYACKYDQKLLDE